LKKFLELGVVILICQAVGALGAVVTLPAISGWYRGLEKPDWTPAAGLFGPVWTILYLMMAVAFWRVWQRRLEPGARRACVLFAVQLVLNSAWSWLFFGLRNPFFGLIDIVLLAGVLAWTVRVFLKVDRMAGFLMVPYLVWVLFASLLNFSLWRMN